MDRLRRFAVLFVLILTVFQGVVTTAHARPDEPVLSEAPPFEGSYCPETWIVRRGNSLSQIAVMCRTTLEVLLELNPEIENPNIIYVGQELRIPPGEGPPVYTTNVTVGWAEALPAGVAAGEKWIDVNLADQQLVAYEGRRPVFQTLISSGLPRYPTVTGQFVINRRYLSKDMDGRPLGYDYYLPGVPYAMYFYKAYAIHGTYWHANFGTPMSHGCVNLPTPAAEWLYNWSELGTVVHVHD